MLPNGYNEEEMKLVKETRKIWVISLFFSNQRSSLCRNLCAAGIFAYFTNYFPFSYLFSFQNYKDVKVTATCIRVPVMRAHAESVNLQFENPLDEVMLQYYLCS